MANSSWRSAIIVFLSGCVIAAAQSAGSQPGVKNLLENPDAELGVQSWEPFGMATIEEAGPGFCFVVRNKGSFVQEVVLDGAVGRFVLMIGRVSSERINPGGEITGLPYLYGLMRESGFRGRITDHLQGQKMRCNATEANQWVYAWGVFEVPPRTGVLRFELSQAERKGMPQNGSAARFDDLGLYVFDSQAAATAFALKLSQTKREGN